VELIEFLLQEDAAVKKYFVNAHLRNNICSMEEMSKFPHSLQNSNANPHYVWVYLLHCCESAFSNMNFIKKELRIGMTNENIHHCFRLAVITLEPNLKELARSKKCHFSQQQNNI